MPAKTVSDEIRHLIRDKGYARDKAIAAALSMQQEGKLVKTAECDRYLKALTGGGGGGFPPGSNWHAEKVPMNNIEKALAVIRGDAPASSLDGINKAEGSRGGHVIGHTSTGKPIYANKGEVIGHLKNKKPIHAPHTGEHHDSHMAHADGVAAGQAAKKKHTMGKPAPKAAAYHHERADVLDAHAKHLQSKHGTDYSGARSKPGNFKDGRHEVSVIGGFQAAAKAHRDAAESHAQGHHYDAGYRAHEAAKQEARLRGTKKSQGEPMDPISKAGDGEGSRGGKIIGHTGSGKPIYAPSGPAGHHEHHGDHAMASHKADRASAESKGAAKSYNKGSAHPKHYTYEAHMKAADAHDTAAVLNKHHHEENGPPAHDIPGQRPIDRARSHKMRATEHRHRANFAHHRAEALDKKKSKKNRASSAVIAAAHVHLHNNLSHGNPDHKEMLEGEHDKMLRLASQLHPETRHNMEPFAKARGAEAVDQAFEVLMGQDRRVSNDPIAKANLAHEASEAAYAEKNQVQEDKITKALRIAAGAPTVNDSVRGLRPAIARRPEAIEVENDIDRTVSRVRGGDMITPAGRWE